MSHESGPGLSDDEIRRYHQLRRELGTNSAPRGVRPILAAVVATLVWLLLVGPLTAGTGQSLSGATRSGQASYADCSRKWQSFGQTWACDARVTWADGATENVTVTSPTDVTDQQGPVVVRHSLGRFNTNTGTANRGAAHVVSADHPHGSQWWNNRWVLSVVGVLLVWTLAGVAITRSSRH
ncbi:DUF6346 domain-containing protein [Propionibacteriaceae bacterium Y1923]